MAGFTFPANATELPKPHRVILHWTGGAHRANWHDQRSYHALVEWLDDSARIRVEAGVPLVNNLHTLTAESESFHENSKGYAAHTRHFNSWSLGYAICAMLGADKNDWGDYPLLEEQVDGLITLCAQTAAIWGMDVDEDTFFTHAEAESIHGRSQGDKWDITVLPQFPGLSIDEVGPWLREQIKGRL